MYSPIYNTEEHRWFLKKRYIILGPNGITIKDIDIEEEDYDEFNEWAKEVRREAGTD